MDLPVSVKDRNVLLVDDVFDSGQTLELTSDLMKKRKAKSVKSFVLGSKRSERASSFEPTYVGFSLPGRWLYGKGMDKDGMHLRHSPHVHVGETFPPKGRVYTRK